MSVEKSALFTFILSFLFVWIVIPFFLPVLRKLHFGQAIREEGPKSHMKKSGTPTMGGIVIQAGILFALIIALLIFKVITVFPALTMIAYGLIGFLDDYIKVSKKHNLGLRAWQKLVLQILFGIIVAVYAGKTAVGTELYIPFVSGTVDFGFWYYPFTFFAIVAVTNAVNLTDGLDGLASGVTGIVMVFFLIMSVRISDVSSAVFSAAVMGACFAFLRHNSNPAALFMGDTGSMALGAAVIVTGIMTRLQIFILIAGFIYVAEALSVCIQVGYFKMTHGKRVFRMAPIHHHFELGGWSETRVVTVFWIVSVLCVALAFLSYFA